MLKKEVLKALVDVDSTTTELANYIGCSTTTLYKLLNGRITNYQKYVGPLHEFLVIGVMLLILSLIYGRLLVLYT